jgi:peptide/nickel transport system substrate-binding protein
VNGSRRRITRRDFLRWSAAAGGGALLVACAPETGQTPSADTSSGTSAPSGPQTAGKFPLGKLEGATVITDAAQFPKTLKEAPELAALVQQGKLPKVADRIGQDPLVLKPAHEVGKYGGTMRKAYFGGVAQVGFSHRFVPGPSGLLYFDYAFTKVVPNIARSYELSADEKTVTVQLRRGMKWSDGEPFTADDIMFWYEDIYGNKQLFPGSSPDLAVGGKPVVIEKVDQYAVRYVSAVPNSLFVERLANPSGDLSGSFRANIGRGGFAPKHYLVKFHPKYAGQEAVDKMAADAKYNGWVSFFFDHNFWQLNPELPVVAPWVVKVSARDANQFVVERNPYSIWVDTDGNQLPYIGTIQYAIAENTELVATRAIAGGYDFQEQLDVGKLPVLIQNESSGGYKVSLDPEQGGVGIQLNLAYEEDPEIGDLIRNVDFRRALSLGVDRAQINEAIFLGSGTVSAVAPADDNRYFPGKEWRTKWATLDVAQANTLLDKVGLTQKDADGFRLRKDGKGRLRLSFLAARTSFAAPMGEMVKQHWQKIGIELLIDVTSSTLGLQRIQANTVQMIESSGATDDVFLNPNFVVPALGGFSQVMGAAYAQWYQSGGAQGKEPFATLKQAYELLDKGKTASAKDRIDLGKQLMRLHIDNVFSIGIVQGDLAAGAVRIAKNNVGNVPGQMINSNTVQNPFTAHPQTFYFK